MINIINCRRHFYILIFLVSVVSTVQGQDTLSNFPLNSSFVAYPADSANLQCGFKTGQSCQYGEAFAEKYTISGKAFVTGIICHHLSRIASFSRQLTFEVYSVGENHLPGTLLASKGTSYRNLVINNPYTTTFNEAVEVEDSFFVACNFLDYAHEPFTDTIAILSSVHNPSGSASYGKNAVRIHHYDWTDLYTRLGLNIHLALFPIVEFPIVNGQSEAFVAKDGLKLYAPFPNPCTNSMKVAFSGKEGVPVEISIVDEMGTVIKTNWSTTVNGSGVGEFDLSDVPNGLYFVIINSEGNSIASKLIKM